MFHQLLVANHLAASHDSSRENRAFFFSPFYTRALKGVVASLRQGTKLEHVFFTVVLVGYTPLPPPIYHTTFLTTLSVPAAREGEEGGANKAIEKMLCLSNMSPLRTGLPCKKFNYSRPQRVWFVTFRLGRDNP